MAFANAKGQDDLMSTNPQNSALLSEIQVKKHALRGCWVDQLGGAQLAR